MAVSDLNPALFISAPMLQDYLVDKDTGLPLSGGKIYLYKDTNRTSFKPWYYQQGTIGSYAFIALDNPLTLSAAGTIQDPNGNDIIPFFYPYNEDNENDIETYFIRVYGTNDDGTLAELQFTRQNFPYVAEEPSSEEGALTNNIVNNRFWRHGGNASGTIALTTPTRTFVEDGNTFYYETLSPSQHDGFHLPDIIFAKNATGAADSITFTEFTDVTAFENDVTPQYYMNVVNSGAGSETAKFIQIPLSLHVKTLGAVRVTFTLQAKNNTGDPDNELSMSIFEFTGTGATSSSVTQLISPAVELNTAWTKFERTIPMPSFNNLVLGSGGDDAFFLRINLPVGVTYNFSIALPSMYVGTIAPTNDFATFDQIDSLINTPRTGDIKTSLNAFGSTSGVSTSNSFGWVILNDGTIGNGSSGSTCRANSDTWPLFNLLWSNVSNTFAPTQDSAGSPSARGVSAIIDFNANKRIVLTLALGRTLLGLPPAATFTYDHLTSLLTVTSATLFYVGAPVTLSATSALPDAFVANTVYYAIPNNSTTIKLASSYANALAGTAIAAGSTDGTGTLTVTFALGGTFGEARHTQIVAELAAHSHLPTGTPSGGTPGFVVDKTAGTISLGGGGSATSAQATTGITGSSSPFNIVQPSVYYNIFMKL